jgi:UDP-hydrolysing UDP-N-acetyl-D-glucosamine 2-epimerase
MKHICVVIHSRANYARVKSVLIELKKHPKCNLTIVVGASGLLFKYGNVAEIIESDGFKIQQKVYAAIEGNDPVVMAKTTGLLVIELSQIFFSISPDLVVTIADRHETLATAIAASYMNIPVCHIQGGEITGSIDDSVRHAITKLSHVHCVSTKRALQVVSQLGEESKRVFLTGCPSLDLVKSTKHEPYLEILKRYFPAKNLEVFQSGFLLVLQHSNTLFYNQARSETEATLSAVLKTSLPTIWLWPNIDSGTDSISKRLREHMNSGIESNIFFCRNFKPEEYINLLKQTLCLIGNSSSGIRESSLIGTPSVNIGLRQQNREVGSNVIHVNFDSEQIFNAISAQIRHGKHEKTTLYGDGSAGKRIAEILINKQVDVNKEFVIWKE